MSELESHPEKRIALFQRKEVRRVIHHNEWWFVVIDVVAALTDSANPTDYFNKFRQRDPEFAKGYGQIVHPLLIPTADGPQKLNYANTEGIFCLIQSIPSPKAEPFKRWLPRLKRENLRDSSGGRPACRRRRASCRPEKMPTIQWLENFRITSVSSCASSAGLEARLYGRQDARRYAGNAHRELEKKSGRKVVTSENYLALTQGTKKAKRIKTHGHE